MTTVAIALAAVGFLAWAIVRGGQLLDAVFVAALGADAREPEPEPERHEHLLDDPQ